MTTKKKQPKTVQPVRLNKFLSMASEVSRRAADDLILEGKISVNGAIVETPGIQIDPENDVVRLGRKQVTIIARRCYLLFNKPRGCLCTQKDDKGRPTIFDILPRLKINLFSVGRLDFNTEGALILTDDGDFSNLLAQPKSGVPKLYRVKVKGIPDQRTLRQMKKGYMVDGAILSFSSVKIDRETGSNCWLFVTLKEGKNRQIHRVCNAARHYVIKLQRIQYGSLKLGSLKPGQLRELTPREVSDLKKQAVNKAPTKVGLPPRRKSPAKKQVKKQTRRPTKKHVKR